MNQSRTGSLEHTLYGHTGPIRKVLILDPKSITPTYAASASADTTIMIWHIAEGRHVRTLSQHKSAVVSISRMTDDGHSKLLSVSEDSFVIIWDWNTGEALREFRAGQFKAGRPGNPITAASFYEPAGTLCLGTHSGDLHLFALPPAQEDNTAREPGSYTVDITDDNAWSIKVWSVRLAALHAEVDSNDAGDARQEQREEGAACGAGERG